MSATLTVGRIAPRLTPQRLAETLAMRFALAAIENRSACTVSLHTSGQWCVTWSDANRPGFFQTDVPLRVHATTNWLAIAETILADAADEFARGQVGELFTHERDAAALCENSVNLSRILVRMRGVGHDRRDPRC